MTRDEVECAYKRYGHLVAARCRRIVRNESTADDAVQETFVRLWRFGDGFVAAESKVGWLYRVADRCCFDQLAKQRGRREDPIEGSRELAGPGHAGQALEDWQIVRAFLDRFDDKMQQVAVLHYVDEMTQEEIAVATGWSRQTVWKKLQLLATRAAALRGSLLGAQAGLRS